MPKKHLNKLTYSTLHSSVHLLSITKSVNVSEDSYHYVP